VPVVRVRGIARWARTDRAARWIDVGIAGLLMIGAMAQVPNNRRTLLVIASYGAALVCVTAVAYRRRAPATAAAVAVVALLGYQLVSSDRQMTFEPYAVFLAYYAFGRTLRRRRRGSAFTWSVLLLALVAFTAVYAHVHQLSGPNVAGSWVLFAIIPAAGGVLIARREATIKELAATTLRLQDEQELRAQLIASRERSAVARDLHDVIAHCVSVMTLQAGGARLVLHRDPLAALSALAVVERSGREALADLRRITGVLRRGNAGPVPPPPGIGALVDLVAYTSAAGVTTTLEIDDPPELPANLQLAAYRIVQEALTNAVKHASGSRVRVSVSGDREALDLRVVDGGGGQALTRAAPAGHGHGLVGMRERVAAYGGELQLRAIAGGGFEVWARLPIPRPDPTESTDAAEPVPAWKRQISNRRFVDVTLAMTWLLILEVEAATSPHRHGSLALNMVIVGIAALSVILRRRYPVGVLLVVGVSAIILRDGLAGRDYATVFGVFSVLIPLYAVTAWAPRRRILPALGLWASVAVAIGVAQHASPGGLIGPMLAATLAAAAGWIVRSQRELSSTLTAAQRRLVVEREDREQRLAEAERDRIARDLNVRVAHGVTAMVIQAEIAQRQLTERSILDIEESGRNVLERLRVILGVLRHSGSHKQLQPQPGLDQIHALIQKSRDAGRQVNLHVHNQPATLNAGVDLAAYRIVDEVLNTCGNEVALDIELRFGERDLQLEVRTDQPCGINWPTTMIRERVALYDGSVWVAPDATRMLINLPRQRESARV
jgi:signal transduction histidine kinase